MRKQIINKPYKSNWIGGLYISITILIALLYIAIYLLAEMYQAPCSLQAVFCAVTVFVFSMMLIMTAGFYTTKYRIKDNVLTSWSPFVFIKVRLKDIKKVEKILYPFNFKVGASFYCGFFYVPNLGWVRTIMTNMRDAVLITTRDGRYFMITPSRPERFMRVLKRR
jgi:hypothetical protein